MSKIFEFQSLSRFPYFTHAASVECAILLHIQWDRSLRTTPGSRAERRGLESFCSQEIQFTVSEEAGAFYIRGVVSVVIVTF